MTCTPAPLAQVKKFVFRYLLGENVADAVLSGDNAWRGDKKDGCSVCHLDHMQEDFKKGRVLCPVCGIYGVLTVKDGKPAIE